MLKGVAKEKIKKENKKGNLQKARVEPLTSPFPRPQYNT
jgi:hypothetical protein